MPKKTESRLVTLSPGGRQFTAQPNTSILESGLSAGIALPFSCANGSCGDCRAKILEGTVSKFQFHDFALTAAEKLSGVCLLCANSAVTDLTIEAATAHSAADIPNQKLRARLCYQTTQNNVTILRFKLARGKALRFLPGQYVSVTTHHGHSVSLPIANCPCDPDYLEFHIPRPRMDKSDALQVFDALSSRERIDIEGPHGNFTLGDLEHHEQLVLIATGGGFATMKPLLEHVISLEKDTPCQFIWIATDSVQHYMNNLCRSWNDAFDSFVYLPLDSADAFSADLLLNHHGAGDTTRRIYISGDHCVNQKIKQQLEKAGVAPDEIMINLADLP